MDGKNACRHTDKKLHNNQNTVDLAGNGVRPVDVDIDSVGFAAATPLLELPANPRFGILPGGRPGRGPDKLRPHIASPYLSGPCLSVLGNVARFIVEHGDLFQLDENEERGLERLVRSIDRRLKQSHGS